MRLPLWLAILAILPPLAPVFGADWPQFLGPSRNGSSPETAPAPWPDSGPAIRWSRPVGAGFSGPVVVGDRVVLHHRRNDEEVIECFDNAHAGESLWRHATPTSYHDDFGFDEGPRATPTIDQDRVFTFGADGVATCVSLAQGERRWRVPLGQELGAGKGFFGFACSPLAWKDRVLFNVGGRDGAGIVALDATTGKVVWKATRHEASYASPVLASSGAEPRALFFTREGFVALDPRDGRVLTEFPWRSPQHASVNAAAPLVLGRRVFLTASYGTGAVLLEWGEDTATPRPVWSGDQALSSHYASVVHHAGCLYGFHGRQEQGPSLRCIEADTGKVLWSEERLGAGSLILVGDQLLVLTEKGELLLAPAERRGFRPTARAQVLGFGTRAFPAYAQGLCFARDSRKLVALHLPAANNSPR